MQIHFTKMHGLGNDFVVIDAINQDISLDANAVRQLADRRFGVGCDQLLLVEAPTDPAADFRYRIFNSDGNEVEQCGNGARCFARFVRDKNLTQKQSIRVETRAGIITLLVHADEQVSVDMGRPRLEPAQIPFDAPRQADHYTLNVDGEDVVIGAVSMGNPHAVLEVEDVDTAPVVELGARIQVHPRFPNKVNVGFMQVLSPEHIRLRVYERGAGETLACGTGACAAVVIGHRQGLLADQVLVDLRGGQLHIAWRGNDQPVVMTGPATSVFEGRIEL